MAGYGLSVEDSAVFLGVFAFCSMIMFSVSHAALHMYRSEWYEKVQEYVWGGYVVLHISMQSIGWSVSSVLFALSFFFYIVDFKNRTDHDADDYNWVFFWMVSVVFGGKLTSLMAVSLPWFFGAAFCMLGVALASVMSFVYMWEYTLYDSNAHLSDNYRAPLLLLFPTIWYVLMAMYSFLIAFAELDKNSGATNQAKKRPSQKLLDQERFFIPGVGAGNRANPVGPDVVYSTLRDTDQNTSRSQRGRLEADDFN